MKRIFIFIFIVMSLQLFAEDATIQIVKKIVKEKKIVVANSSDQLMDHSLNNKILRLVIGDLKVSSHFNVDNNYINKDYQSTALVNELVENGTELLLKCKIEKNGDSLKASVKLVNVRNGDRIYEKFYSISKSKRYPFLSHHIAIDLNDYLGMPSISWMKRYVIFAKYVKSGASNIVVSDYTLSFQRTIVSGGLNIFPKWATNAQDSFYYTSYKGVKPTLYLVNLFSGQKTQIASSSGMMVCSDVSSDGSKLLLTMAPYDQPDIYLYNVASGQKKRLTSYSGIDVSGNFVDNDNGVVFISERLGYPNIFYKNINGGKVDQMVYHGRNNSSCTTHGKYIVYSSRDKQSSFGKSTFNLYLISTQTDLIRKLTTNGKNMFPRFSLDGETLLFIKHMGKRSALGVLRLNANRSFLFPLNVGKIQAIDW